MVSSFKAMEDLLGRKFQTPQRKEVKKERDDQQLHSTPSHHFVP